MVEEGLLLEDAGRFEAPMAKYTDIARVNRISAHKTQSC